ncbi:MAG TPA: FAD-dependent oxidoreductase [Anaerolineae bacterium]
MAKPVIVTVDDDKLVLNAVERDLRQKYGQAYRIIKADSGAAALELLQTLQTRGEMVALFVVDQRMPEMSGVQFLEKAIALYPDARRVLLTAYADTQAAIFAINQVGLDYYLMKPWDPPVENLYPVVDDLLEDWQAKVRPAFEGIRVAGTLWSPQSHEVKDFLARNQIPYLWLDIERDPKAKEMVLAANKGELRVPTVFFPDGTIQVEPTEQQLAEKAGMSTHANQKLYDVVIIGGGPAGLSAAVYAASDGLRVLLVERQAPGGQAGNSPRIENYLGFPAGISGGDLTRRAVAQAKRFGAEILEAASVTGVRAEGNTRIVTLADGTEITSKIVLIATGAWFRTLTTPGVEKFQGAGIYYGAAHTEAVYYRDCDVVVIGAKNSAAQGIIFLARYARSVTVLIRGSDPDWSNYLNPYILDNPKIKLMKHWEMIEARGASKLEKILIKNNETGETREMDCSAVFVFIGQKPQSEFVSGLVLRTDDTGHILTGLSLLQGGKRPKGWTPDRDPLAFETSVPGIFAVGDVRYGTKNGVAAAIGEGDTAVSLFWEYLQTI